MLGLGLVSIHKTNMTVNGLTLPQGEPLFQNGMKNKHRATSKVHHVMYRSFKTLNQWHKSDAVLC